MEEQGDCLEQGQHQFFRLEGQYQGSGPEHQFPARWELERARNPKVPGPRDYGGESPLSEPEAIAMANLTRRRDFSRVIGFHTQGQVIYWGFENLEPPESAGLAREFARVSGYEKAMPDIRIGSSRIGAGLDLQLNWGGESIRCRLPNLTKSIRKLSVFYWLVCIADF